MVDAADRVRFLLAGELKFEERFLVHDFRWLEVLGSGDAGYFLARLNSEFGVIPRGFSAGAGKRPFEDHIDAQMLERIATVGGLIEFVQAHLAEQLQLRKRPSGQS